MNSNLFRHADLAGIERHGRFLAKRGVNMVRAHVQLGVDRDGSRITDVDARTIDDVRRLVAGMKRAGIYTTISPYWAAAQKRVPASWGLDHPPDRDAQGLVGVVGTDVDYAPYVEFGTFRAAAQPYLRPSLIEGVR